MANRRIGQAGLALIKQFEGCRLIAYQCSAGVWTIGYGHTVGVYNGMKITQKKAEAYLLQDIAKFEKYINIRLMCRLRKHSTRISLMRWYHSPSIWDLAILRNYARAEQRRRSQ